VKTIRILLPVMLALILGLGVGCAKKVIHSEATPFAPLTVEAKPPEIKPEEKPAEKLEATAPDQLAVQERERKIKEEALREETLREKSLREKAFREETAQREALAREAALKKINLESIYFDYDQAVIVEGQKEIMLKNSQWLKANPQARIKIEGNCDERGTAEYNLALGQRRADAAKDFLEGLGINSKRMQTISYGFERPLQQGHDEAAWAKNRRVDFVLIR
jgi:peptidoglycan-associated lipoprotein